MDNRQLLVEHDAGSVVINKENIISESFIYENSNTSTNKVMYVDCILQKANTKNRNGRIYPKAILEREMNKYAESIKDGNAVSENGHPECYAEGAKILTYEGWKDMSQISDDELVATLNTETNKLEYQKIIKKIDEEYEGDMYEIKGNSFSALVTPNHRFLITHSSSGERKYIKASEIDEAVLRSGKWVISKTALWESENEDEFFTLKGVELPNTKKFYRDRMIKDVKIDKKIWFAFMGIYLSEGHANGVKNTGYENKSKHLIGIHQYKKEIVEMIDDLLKQFPDEIRWNKTVNKYGKTTFYVNDARLHNYLFRLGDSYTKHIPIELKQDTSENLSILMEWFLLGDGRCTGNGKNKQKNVFSTSLKLIEDLQEILLKSGGSGNLHKENRVGKDVYFIDVDLEGNRTKRLIKGENRHDMYFLNLSHSKNIYLDKRFTKINKVNYKGRVYCVTTPNSNFYVMYNNKCYWTGNSTVIDLNNIPHRVVKYWWDGDTVMGTLEILTSESYMKTGQGWLPGDKIAEYLKKGVKLGISSRGVGSVQTKGGIDYVQDDFELIGFDLVHSPSTIGAYLFTPKNTMSESKITTKSNPLDNILDKFLD